MRHWWWWVGQNLIVRSEPSCQYLFVKIFDKYLKLLLVQLRLEKLITSIMTTLQLGVKKCQLISPPPQNATYYMLKRTKLLLK